LRLKKNPVTPEGLKADWSEILPRINDILADYRGNEWFSQLLRIARDWSDAELEKAVPQSPEIAISVILDPLAKNSFFRPLIKNVESSMREQIFCLRQELAMFRKKSRMIDWNGEAFEVQAKKT
jgi:hypothetical protein